MNQRSERHHDGDDGDVKKLPFVEIDKAFSLLKKLPNIPGTVRSFFGRENVGKVVDFFASDEVVEVDAMVMSGQFSDEEYVQYVTSLTDLQLLDEEIHTIAVHLVECLRPRFCRIANATINQEKLDNIYFVHNQIVRLGNSLVPGVSAPFRTRLVEKMVDTMLIVFFVEMEKIFSASEFSQNFNVYLKSRSDLFNHYESKIGNIFPPSGYLTSRKGVELCLRNTRFLSNLTRAFPPLHLSSEEKIQLKKEFEQQHAEIRELSKFRKIFFTPWESGEAKLAIMGDDVTAVPGSGVGICSGTITLNPLEDLEQPLLKKEKNGKQYLIVRERDGVINFSVNRLTGEICYFGSTGFCLNDVIPEHYYLAIKKRIYAMLLDYLWEKEPDIEDLFAKRAVSSPCSERAEKDVATEIQKLASDVFISDEEKEIQDGAANISSNVKGLVDEPDAIGEAGMLELSESFDGNERRKRFEYFRRLKGLKGQKALAALKRLFSSEPVRVRGSHFIFESPRNGRILPIPIHMAVDVNIFFLKNSLEGLGYDLEEFCEVL